MSTLQERGKLSKFAVMKAAERETLRQWIYDFDDKLGDARIVVSYDALEKISNDWEPYVLALLAFWSDLAPRLKAISPKIFIREDIRDRVKDAWCRLRQDQRADDPTTLEWVRDVRSPGSTLLPSDGPDPESL
jgi:hypothetical protein